MALTNTILQRNVMGVQRANLVRVAFDASYPTGGEAITANALGLNSQIQAIFPAGASPYGAGAYTVQFDSATSKLLAISLADGAEAGDTTDLSAWTIDVLAFGR